MLKREMEQTQREDATEIVTSWMRAGIEQGERSLILLQLNRQVGEISEILRSRLDSLSIEQLEALGEALLDFRTIADLETWLQPH